MELIRNKKSMYFTIGAIIFMVVFLFFFLMPSYRFSSDSMSAVEMRVIGINTLIKSIERDIERGLYISSFRALLSLESYVVQKGQFLSNTDGLFKETLLNGTINGENASFMEDSRLEDWIKSIEDEGSKLNLDINITVKDISLYQNDPWYVSILINYSLFVNDTTGVASWYRDTVMETRISVIGFEDPLYIVYGLGRVSNAINRTMFDNNFTFYKNSTWNMSNLNFHIENSLYAAHDDAPSYLMRFENDISPSEYGIESMVNLKELSDNGIEIDESSSIIDHHYWEGDGNGDYRINDTPSWVKIDNGHRSRYNVTGLSYGVP